MHTFAQNLKLSRSLKKLTQIQVAETLGIKKRNYCSYEEGRAEPKYSILLELAQLFDVTVDFLLTGSSATLKEELSPWEQEYNRATMHTRYTINKLLGY